MKRISSALLCLCMILCLVPISAAHTTPDLEGVIGAAIAAPDMFYAPSGDIEDYTVSLNSDGTYTVSCFGEMVGTAWVSADGAVGYASVNKRADVTPMQTIYETRRLSVPPLKQPTDTTCWATCCSMVVRYYKDNGITPAAIAAMRPNASGGGEWSDMDAVYNGVYHLNIGQVERTLKFTEIWALLGNDRPIHIGGEAALARTNTRHSMLIVGAAIGSNNNVLYINEPQGGVCFAYDITAAGWGNSTSDKGIEFKYSGVDIVLSWDKSRWKNVG